jgi:long-subunit acyl-CoA synthetase (AMP-forming)
MMAAPQLQLFPNLEIAKRKRRIDKSDEIIAQIFQAYGLTETCAASFISMLWDNTPSQVGPPARATVCRLEDWEEGGYRNSDINNPDIGMRRGEVTPSFIYFF